MSTKTKFVIGGLVVVAIAAGALLLRSGTISFDAAQASALSAKEVEQIVRDVGRHIRVPDEEPLIALITDIDSLVAEQEFYRGAENGDILLVYPSISKAILFSPDDDVLINVGPIVFDEETVPAPVVEEPEEEVEE